MKKYLVIIAILFWASCTRNDSHNVAYENGFWFDGTTFIERTIYSKDGIITDQRPSRIDTTFNLTGKYLIPPFGDAHTHELGSAESLEEMLPRFIEDGIFYVQVLTNHAAKIVDFRDEFSSPNTLDVVYSNGGLTSTLGHPFVAFETQAMGLHWSAMFSQRERVKESRLAEKDAYWFLDSPEDVFVTPTAIFARVYATNFLSDGTRSVEEERQQTVNDFLKEEIQCMHRAGVRIAIGADQYRETAMLELHYLYEHLEVFDAETLLTIGTYNTPSAIFPDRKIGRFDNGYEASFLALDENPLGNWSALRSISLRVKQGTVLR